MEHISTQRISWREALKKEKPLLLPVAHDALTARIIEQAGFTAYQIGGFAVAGARHGLPDLDLTHFAERYAAVRDIMASSALPLMVDGDDGYGDVKNVTHTVRSYEALGVSAIFLEDQQAPKECGHMDNKHVVPTEQMVGKIKAAAAAKRDAESMFIVARTDALAPEGVASAIKRGEAYLKAGADGVYVEGPTSVDELKQIGKAFKGVPLATSILENGGKTPWVSPAEMGEMGYAMILYPTTILFQLTKALQRAAGWLSSGRPLPHENAVDMEEYMKIVDLEYWQEIEKKFKTQ